MQTVLEVRPLPPSRLEVYAVEVAVWREEVLDSLDMEEFCFNAHGQIDLAWIVQVSRSQ
jgi:hypothetical protein